MSSDVTRILTAIEQGDPAAADQLVPLVYQELRKLAASRLSHEKAGQTIQSPNLESLFLAALQISDPGERMTFLDESSGDDRQLRGKLEQMLAAESQRSRAQALGAGQGLPAANRPPCRPGPSHP